MTIELKKPFAGNSPANERDVRAMKRSLNWLGYYSPHKKTGLTEIADSGVFAALKRFQADQNLPATGQARPGDDTIKAINAAVQNKLEGEQA